MKRHITMFIVLLGFVWMLAAVVRAEVPRDKQIGLEKAIEWIALSCRDIDDPLPEEQLRAAQKRANLSDEEVRQILLKIVSRTYLHADERESRAMAGTALHCLGFYGKPEDNALVWQALSSNPNMFRLPCLRVYLQLSQFDVDDLPRKLKAHPELFGDVDQFNMMRELSWAYARLEPATQASIVQFFQESVAVEDRTDVASLIDEFLREHVEGYMESPERRELVRRFGHMKGWKGGTEMGEGVGVRSQERRSVGESQRSVGAK
jgi:hypothetical protein